MSTVGCKKKQCQFHNLDEDKKSINYLSASCGIESFALIQRRANAIVFIALSQTASFV